MSSASDREQRSVFGGSGQEYSRSPSLSLNAVLCHSYGIPGFIGEASFFTNPDEEERLRSAEYNRLEALAGARRRARSAFVPKNTTCYVRPARWGLPMDLEKIQAAMHTLNRSISILIIAPLIGGTLVVSGCGFADKAVVEDRLNLIIISLDTLRADHLGCYGYNRNTSPHIDQFARESTVFQNSFANSNWTLPSHMSLMTSRYPTEHGVREKTHRLSPRIPTLAEVLRREGYLTAAFTAGYFVDRKFGFDRGFGEYNQSYDVRRPNIGQGWRLEHLEKDLFAWLDAHHKESFFLFVHSYDVHQPFIAHEYLEEFSPAYQGRLTSLHNMKTLKASPKYRTYKEAAGDKLFNITFFVNNFINTGVIDLDDADREHLVALYDNEIRYADEYFGRIREKLEKLDLWENTAIVLWSDHGEELFERGGVRHGGQRLYDELLNVPLVIRIPGAEHATQPNLAQGIDIAPTVLDILNIPRENSFAGRSLFDADARNAFVIAEGSRCECIRTDRSKLIVRHGGRTIEYFDIAVDPNERYDLAMEQPGRVDELRKTLNEALNRLVTDEKMQKQLEALGYID